MKSLYYYNPATILRIDTNNEITKWKKMYAYTQSGMTLTDRVGNFKGPLQTLVHSSCIMPAFRPTDLTYNDCCNLRAKQLMELSINLQKPLGIMWSGGVDSTRVLVAFLENFPLTVLKTHLRIVMSAESVIENPVFYKKYILSNFEIINSEYLPWLFDKNVILVTGYHNDWINGGDISMAGYKKSNAAKFTKPFNQDHIIDYMNTIIKDTEVATIMVNAGIDSAKIYGRPLEVNCDWFFWWNFCFKWQAWLLLLSTSMPRYWPNINEDFINTYVHSFFNTDAFQLWAINNPLYRDTSQQYKQITKQGIFNFDHDQNYFDNKKKQGSLRSLFVHRAKIDAIDSNFNIIPVINMKEYHCPDNSFSNCILDKIDTDYNINSNSHRILVEKGFLKPVTNISPY